MTITRTLSLDGNDWLILADPSNAGREEEWQASPRPHAVKAAVPGVIQAAFHDYHGAAWYWRELAVPAHHIAGGRFILRFAAVDYLADVWVNGHAAGRHEGGETPFALDVTAHVRPGGSNLVAVRVLNPTYEPIDGVALKETPSGLKQYPVTSNASYNAGGIVDSVELVMAPAVHHGDLWVRPEWMSGAIAVRLDVCNRTDHAVTADVVLRAAPSAGGQTCAALRVRRVLEPGVNAMDAVLRVDGRRQWSPEDPFLYRVSSEVSVEGSDATDERSTRCGFRDFRFESGYFRLNGRRILLKGCMFNPLYPVSYTVPPNADMLQRDVVQLKAMGHNFTCVVFGGSRPRLMDAFDEAGILVHLEHFGSWQMKDSPRMAERYDRSVGELIRRDRNHPSVVMWGLLNETPDDPVFRRAVEALPLYRALDPDRLIVLNSGRFDGRWDVGSMSSAGSAAWDVGAEALLDVHPYTHSRAEEMGRLRAAPESFLGMKELPSAFARAPVYASEYGHSGLNDVLAFLRGYERMGALDADDARYVQGVASEFLADWDAWRLRDCWTSPEAYSEAGHRYMTQLRRPTDAALRSNPRVVALSSTQSIVDMATSGSGAMTLFREVKPGVTDALLLANAPLRWCLFAEPANAYAGGTVRLEAVLANEDRLQAGAHPVRIELVGPDGACVLARTASVTVPPAGAEAPFALPVFAEDVVMPARPGRYRFTASLGPREMALGGEETIDVYDASAMPALPDELALWGADPAVAEWFRDRGVRILRLDDVPDDGSRLILSSGTPPAPGGEEAFKALMRRVDRGSRVVFLDPSVFSDGKDSTRWLPLQERGFFDMLNWVGTYYRADFWAKTHPVFDGLPAGGFMDWRVYREIISEKAFTCREQHIIDLARETLVTRPISRPDEAVCGGIRMSANYDSGFCVGAYRRGRGSFLLNALLIRENLGKDPVAERLLRNMLRFMAV